MLNLPNAVEGFLDVADKHQHGEQHEYKAYSKKYAALGVYKIRVDKPDNGFCRLWLARQGIPKPHLDILGKTKPTSNGEHHGHDRYDGQNCAISERRGQIGDASGGEKLHRNY